MMTEYELVDAIASFNSNMQSWITVYLTTLSAYLVTAYVVGASLTKSQAFIINSCFVTFSGLFTFATTGSANRCLDFYAEVQAINPKREFALTPEVLWLGTAILLMGIFVGLKFMWDVRHPKTE